MTAWFYILRLQSGALYIGATKNLEKRYAEHCAGSASRTTSLDPPISLAYYEELESFSKAALVAGDMDKLRALSKSHKN